MDVPFTQYLRPSGLPIPVLIDRPNYIVEQARAALAKAKEIEP